MGMIATESNIQMTGMGVVGKVSPGAGLSELFSLIATLVTYDGTNSGLGNDVQEAIDTINGIVSYLPLINR